MATYTFTRGSNSVIVVENGATTYVRPFGFDTLADGGNSVVIEQRTLGGSIWGRRIYLTDTTTIEGVLFSGTSAQLITALAAEFSIAVLTTDDVTFIQGLRAVNNP